MLRATGFLAMATRTLELDVHGQMRLRLASVNNQPIRKSDFRFCRPLAPRPGDRPDLSGIGL